MDPINLPSGETVGSQAEPAKEIVFLQLLLKCALLLSSRAHLWTRCSARQPLLTGLGWVLLRGIFDFCRSQRECETFGPDRLRSLQARKRKAQRRFPSTSITASRGTAAERFCSIAGSWLQACVICRPETQRGFLEK